VGARLVIRLRVAPTDEELVDLNTRFGDLCAKGEIRATDPLAAERSSDDHLDLPRLAIDMDFHKVGRIPHLVRALNDLTSAPTEAEVPREGETNPFPAETATDPTG
jgi:hypothetical protein